MKDYQFTSLWGQGCKVSICMHVQSHARVYTPTQIYVHTHMYACTLYDCA